MRIIRHELDITHYQVVPLDGSGELLSVAQSRTEPNTLIDLWSIDQQRQVTLFVGVYIIGTGHPMPPELSDPERFSKFLGTVVTPSGLVWHVFQGPVR